MRTFSIRLKVSSIFEWFGCRPEEIVHSSERILDEKGLEELDTILGIVHGEPFTEKRSEFKRQVFVCLFVCLFVFIFDVFFTFSFLCFSF